MNTDSWNDMFCLVSDSRLHLLPDPVSKAFTESDFMVLRTRQKEKTGWSNERRKKAPNSLNPEKVLPKIQSKAQTQ